MGAFFWGGLGKGLGKGLEDAQTLQLKRDEAKLRTRMLDAQIKHQDAQARMDEAKELRFRKLGETRESAASAFKQALTGGMPGAPMVEEPGDPAIAPKQIQGQPGAGKPGRDMTPQEILTHAAISDPSHQIPSELFKDPKAATAQRGFAVGPGGAVVSPTGQELYRNPTERMGVGTDAQLFAIQKKVQAGTATPEERGLYQAWVGKAPEAGGTVGAIAEARGAGSQQGQLGVRQTPGYIQNKTDVATATAAGAPIPEGAAKEIGGLEQIVSDAKLALQHFDPALVGPGAGRAAEAQRYFGETPIIGGLVNKMGTGAPLTESQSTFMQSVARMKNAIRTAQFGATLTGNEKKAAEQELASMEESPTSAKVRLQNVFNIFSKAAARQRGLTGQTRGGANVQGQGVLGGAPAPTGKLRFNPATGRIE